jgi:hypothetical protein
MSHSDLRHGDAMKSSVWTGLNQLNPLRLGTWTSFYRIWNSHELVAVAVVLLWWKKLDWTGVRGQLGTLLSTLLIAPNYSMTSLDLHIYFPPHLWSWQPLPTMYEHIQTCMNIREHLRRSMNISEVLRRSSNDFEDLHMSAKPFAYATFMNTSPPLQVLWTPSVVTYNTHKVS